MCEGVGLARGLSISENLFLCFPVLHYDVAKYVNMLTFLCNQGLYLSDAFLTATSATALSAW